MITRERQEAATNVLKIKFNGDSIVLLKIVSVLRIVECYQHVIGCRARINDDAHSPITNV